MFYPLQVIPNQGCRYPTLETGGELPRDIGLFLVAGSILVALIVFRLTVTTDRFLNLDELVHLNAAYFIARGETLYVSFFENHPPLMALLLQPIVRSVRSPEAMIYCARTVMLVLTGGTLLVVAGAAYRVGGRLAAWVAPSLLLSHTFFFQKTVEVRPDVPALLLFVLAIHLSGRAVSAQKRSAFFLLGSIYCTAGLFTPKVIYASGGAAMATALAAGWHSSHQWRRAAQVLGWIILGGVSVAALAFAAMARQGILGGFLSEAVTQSLRMTIDNPAAFRWGYLSTTARLDALMWVASILGAGILLRKSSEAAAVESFILLASFAAGFLGLFVIDAPMRQFFLTFLPQAAIFASVFLAAFVSAIEEHFGRPLLGAGALFVALLSAVAIPVTHLLRNTPSMRPQLVILKRVLELTEPSDRVFDCFTGLYLTRLPAYRYFFLNSDVQRLLTPEELRQGVIRALGNPTVKLLLLDRDCRKLPAPIHRSIEETFVPLDDRDPLIWLRKK